MREVHTNHDDELPPPRLQVDDLTLERLHRALLELGYDVVTARRNRLHLCVNPEQDYIDAMSSEPSAVPRSPWLD